MPHANPAVEFSQVIALKDELDELRGFDSGKFPGLQAAAQRVLLDAKVDTTDPLACALLLERHFLYSNRYRYSLHLNFQRDRRLDPIEDFVVHHHTGHCEYFASALVLMLRSQGIPARIVVGYKTGEYNMLGRYYVVRQKHAHAWVEAWMPPGAVPESEIAGTPNQGGCWYRLDPTPASGEYLVGAPGTTLQGQITDVFDYFELMWRDYVVNLNSYRQPQAVVDPGNVSAADVLPGLINGRFWEQWRRRIASRLGLQYAGRASQGERSSSDWGTAALVIFGLVAVLGLVQLASFLLQKLASWLGWRAGVRRRFHRPPAFYRHLERLLARMPLRRGAGQTAVELAESARTELAGRAADSRVAELPGEVVQTYYRVRFGGDTLDDSEAAAIEHALAQLAPAVGQVPRAPSVPPR
jgi:hypothetical protein